MHWKSYSMDFRNEPLPAGILRFFSRIDWVYAEREHNQYGMWKPEYIVTGIHSESLKTYQLAIEPDFMGMKEEKETEFSIWYNFFENLGVKEPMDRFYLQGQVDQLFRKLDIYHYFKPTGS